MPQVDDVVTVAPSHVTARKCSSTFGEDPAHIVAFTVRSEFFMGGSLWGTSHKDSTLTAKRSP
jgi:hypothetical protein